MSATSTLTFSDGESLADLATYVARARKLDADGAIRLQAVGEVLAAWVCVVPGQGVLGNGTVLGLRTMPVVAGRDLDVTVPLAGLSDRFARRVASQDVGASLTVPPIELAPTWAAVSPPRGGWRAVGQVRAGALLEAARDGIAEVAQGAPEGAGALAVSALRQRVWGRGVTLGDGVDGVDGVEGVDATRGSEGGHEGGGGRIAAADGVTGGGVGQVPAGAGLAVLTLGFAREGGQQLATVFRSGPWLRLSLPAGHVLCR